MQNVPFAPSDPLYTSHAHKCTLILPFAIPPQNSPRRAVLRVVLNPTGEEIRGASITALILPTEGKCYVVLTVEKYSAVVTLELRTR